MKSSKFGACALCALLMASCGGNKNEKAVADTPYAPIDYTLTVDSIEGSDSAYIYLYDYDALESTRNPNQDAIIDSVMVNNGKAVFSVKGSSAPIALLMLNGRRCTVFPEAGEVTVNFASNNQSGEIAKKYNAYRDSITSILLWADKNVPEKGSPAYTAFSDSIDNVLDTYRMGMLDENINNGLGFLLAVEICSDPEKVDSVLAKYPNLATTKRMIKAQERAENLKATSVGQPYKDFTVESNGKSVKLSEYVKPGAYTLVDFWASWCGPCKRAIAQLKKNYEQLHADGLNIVGVTVWEAPGDTEAWLKENPLPWDIILDAQYGPTDLYAVTGIPTMVLIGPDGKILARSHSDEEVIEAFTAAKK